MENGAPKKDIPVNSPAFQWAQSLDNVFLSIKLATRHDTPGCLDIFEPNITLDSNRFNMTVFCRSVLILLLMFA